MVRGREVIQRALLAVVMACSVLTAVEVATPPPAASADPGALTLTWGYGGDPNGDKCTITASIVGPDNGRVRLNGRFHGCGSVHLPPKNKPDGILNVIGRDLDGNQYGGSTPWCPTTCAYEAMIPFTGSGTYCGMVSYFDHGYMIRTGNDPTLRPCRYITNDPRTFPPDEIPAPPPHPNPVPDDPPEPPAPIPCPQITSVRDLPSGTLLETCDTGRVYKMVGGAALWVTNCANSMCPGTPIKVTQAVVDSGRPWPADNATAQDEAGNVFKFVGGAPIHLSSCTVGCGTPARVPAGTLRLVHPANYLRQRPIDSATARDEAGHIFKFVGGAPIHLSSCTVGCGKPVPLTGWSVANLDHMNPHPVDGATAQDEAGNVFKFVGGTPIHLSNCSVGCGSPVPITAWSIIQYEHMLPRPKDGATAVDESGNIFKFVGGAPIHLSSCSVGCGTPVPINGWSVATLEHMNPVPRSGATAVDESGNVFRFVGGAPIHLSNCNIGCGTPVRITGVSIATLDHMRPFPADHATAHDEAGKVYKFVGGAPVHVTNCVVGGCDSSVKINAWSFAALEHMRPYPNNGATVRDDLGRMFKFAGGAPMALTDCVVGCSASILVNALSVDRRDHMNAVPVDGTRLVTPDGGNKQYHVSGGVPDPAGTCPGAAGCTTAVSVNAWAVAHPLLDGTRVKDAGSPGQAAIVGGAKVAFVSQEELDDAGYGTRPLLTIPQRMWAWYRTTIEDGTRLKDAGSTGQAAVVGSAKITFFSQDEVVATGYADEPLQVIPTRVWDAMSTRIADGTRLKDSGSTGQAGVVGGAKVAFVSQEELEAAGYGTKPVQVIPTRVWSAMSTRIADGTRLKDSGSTGQAGVVGGAKIAFASQEELEAAGYGTKPVQVIPTRVWGSMSTQIEDRTLVKPHDAATVAMVLSNTRVDYANQQEVDALGCNDRPTQVVPARVFNAISDDPDRLFAAANKAVDVDRITPTPLAWRKNCHQVFRADDRDPPTNFGDGFHPWDVNGEYDLYDYVHSNAPSPFVSTTYRDDLYRDPSFRKPYYYCIDAPGGIDVNETIGYDHPLADEEEVAYPGGVDRRFIVGVRPYNPETGQLGQFTRNASYTGRRGNEWCTQARP